MAQTRGITRQHQVGGWGGREVEGRAGVAMPVYASQAEAQLLWYVCMARRSAGYMQVVLLASTVARAATKQQQFCVALWRFARVLRVLSSHDGGRLPAPCAGSGLTAVPLCHLLKLQLSKRALLRIVCARLLMLMRIGQPQSTRYPSTIHWPSP